MLALNTLRVGSVPSRTKSNARLRPKHYGESLNGVSVKVNRRRVFVTLNSEQICFYT